MGIVRKTVTKRVACDHFDSHGNFCRTCGARKLLLGVGYELGWVEVDEEVGELCDHSGETGSRCSKCGDELPAPPGPDPGRS
jgi:hypothetical protein